MKDFAEALKHHTERIDNVLERLDTINKMFDHNPDKIEIKYAGFILNDKVDIVTVFQTDEISITRGIYKDKDTLYPLHCHNESIEYLVITRGSFTLEIVGQPTKLLNRGDITIIPICVEHSVISLEDNSEMYAICIPPEKAYTK